MDDLAKHLTTRSIEICQDVGCTEDEHNCESYAYISYNYDEEQDKYSNLQLLDVCLSDYFQGTSKDYIALPLPFSGNAKDLLRAIKEYDYS